MINVEDISARGLSDMIDSAVMGTGSWQQFVVELARSFPGAKVAIQNKNLAAKRFDLLAIHNFEESYIRSYDQYYAARNPWLAIWERIPSGTIGTSERLNPTRSHHNSEFYNDWMRPQDAGAGAGIKVDETSGEAIELVMHLPLSCATAWDPVIFSVLEGLKGSLTRGVRLARLMRPLQETAIGAAAVVARSPDVAFVIQADNRIVEANQQALEAFSSGRVFAARGRKVRLTDPEANQALAMIVGRLCRHEVSDNTGFSFRVDDEKWQLSFAALKPNDLTINNHALLLPTRRMVLVIARNVSAPKAMHLDHEVGRRLYKLTNAETNLCRLLLSGESLADAAQSLRVEKETARGYLKSIFAKTETSRQGELLLLLSRLS